MVECTFLVITVTFLHDIWRQEWPHGQLILADRGYLGLMNALMPFCGEVFAAVFRKWGPNCYLASRTNAA